MRIMADTAELLEDACVSLDVIWHDVANITLLVCLVSYIPLNKVSDGTFGTLGLIKTIN